MESEGGRERDGGSTPAGRCWGKAEGVGTRGRAPCRSPESSEGRASPSPLSRERLPPERPCSVWFDSMGNNAWAHSLDLPLGFLPLAQAMGAGV